MRNDEAMHAVEGWPVKKRKHLRYRATMSEALSASLWGGKGGGSFLIILNEIE